jgi:Bacterial TSP3 repeat
MKSALRVYHLAFGVCCLAFAVSTQPAQAFPPAPHHILYGTVRNQWGDPLNIAGAIVTLENPAGQGLNVSVAPALEPGVNYQIKVPMDSGLTSDLYQPTALRPFLPFRLRVIIDSTVFLPLEMAGDYAQIGQPGEKTRIDLTLGVDSDGDGLPDAWEQALIAMFGGDLESIRPGDDSDGDGISNMDEYLAGTYAFDPTDGFSLGLVEIKEGATRLEFMALRDHTYSILSSTDLKVWTPVQFRIAADGPQAPLLNNYRATDVRRLQVEVPYEPGAGGSRYFKALVE